MWENKCKLLTRPNTKSQIMKRGNIFKQLKDTYLNALVYASYIKMQRILVFILELNSKF